MASLESLWKSGREGTLSPLEQLRAWALFTVQKCAWDMPTRHMQVLACILLSMTWPPQRPTIIPQHLRPQELLKDPRGARECALKDPDALSEA